MGSVGVANRAAGAIKGDFASRYIDAMRGCVGWIIGGSRGE